MDKLSNIVTAMLQHNPSHLNSEMNLILENGHEDATRITNMVQQAQNKKLSVDLLTPNMLKQVFQHLLDQAESQNLELLISQPLDLFQIDTFVLARQQDCHSQPSHANGNRRKQTQPVAIHSFLAFPIPWSQYHNYNQGRQRPHRCR